MNVFAPSKRAVIAVTLLTFNPVISLLGPVRPVQPVGIPHRAKRLGENAPHILVVVDVSQAEISP